MASSISFPEDKVSWFIKGNAIGVVSDSSTTGSTRTARKAYKAIDHTITDGLLIHYWAEPKKVTAITDTPDIDNVFHSSIIDYVKSRLYQDRAGLATDGNIAGVSLNLSQVHERKWIEATKKHGANKRDKTGGTRMIRLPDFT